MHFWKFQKKVYMNRSNDQVEASQVVAVTHCARAVAQGNIQLATAGGPLLGCQVPKTTLPVESKVLLRKKFNNLLLPTKV